MSFQTIIQEKIEKEYRRIEEEILKPNILIVGGTGVGKSSLINLCFGKDIASYGVGKPVTENTKAYEDPDIPLVLFDTKGYEIGSEEQENFLKEILAYAVEDKDKDIKKQIHIVWYCIQSSSHRITDFDREMMAEFKKNNKPLAIIFTKCDMVTDDEIEKLKSVIKKDKKLFNIPIFRSTIENLPDLGHLDLKELLVWSTENLAVSLRLAFVRAQKLHLDLKKRQANKIVIQHVAGAGLIGMAPIPFSDAPILIANQAVMFARVFYLYDMKSLLLKIEPLISSTVLGAISSNVGVWLVGNILKLIPGVGTIVGSMVSGSIAALITLAIGFACSEICYRIYKCILEGNKEELEYIINNIISLLKDIIMENLKKKQDELIRENQ